MDRMTLLKHLGLMVLTAVTTFHFHANIEEAVCHFSAMGSRVGLGARDESSCICPPSCQHLVAKVRPGPDQPLVPVPQDPPQPHTAEVDPSGQKQHSVLPSFIARKAPLKDESDRDCVEDYTARENNGDGDCAPVNIKDNANEDDNGNNEVVLYCHVHQDEETREIQVSGPGG